jgi:hypothetical protein
MSILSTTGSSSHKGVERREKKKIPRISDLAATWGISGKKKSIAVAFGVKAKRDLPFSFLFVSKDESRTCIVPLPRLGEGDAWRLWY